MGAAAPRPSQSGRPDRRQLGQAAEDAALAHLLARGCTLLARNARYPFGEVDLVVRDGAIVAFVEVRFRKGAAFGGAAVSVDATKRRKLARAAQAWLKAHHAEAASPCRFDVVAVTPARGALHCEWIAGAFTLDDLY
jgi:putative endonuclease